MLAAFGFGMAAAPTGDPWRAMGIGGMAALSMKQDGMTRYQSALTNLSSQYENNQRYYGEQSQNNRVDQINVALKMQEADQRAKGIYSQGSDRATPEEKRLEELYKREAEILAQGDMADPAALKNIQDQIKKIKSGGVTNVDLATIP